VCSERVTRRTRKQRLGQDIGGGEASDAGIKKVITRKITFQKVLSLTR
jgi:hypothetical protein